MHFILMDKEERETIIGEERNELEVFCDCIAERLEDEHVEISIHALAGGNEHKTIRLKGVIKERCITTLIDDSSTH